jgi:hypothetical protein
MPRDPNSQSNNWAHDLSDVLCRGGRRNDRLGRMLWDLLTRLVCGLFGRSSARVNEQPATPTGATRMEVARLRSAYVDTQRVIDARWTTIHGYTNVAGLTVLLVILLMLTKLLVEGPNSVPEPALLVAVFAVVAGVFGALIQSFVTHVVSLEKALEDLGGYLDVAEGAATDAEAVEAIANAQRVIDGRLRWARPDRQGFWGVQDRPEGPSGRRYRIAFGLILQISGGVVLGFLTAVAIQGMRDGILDQALNVSVGPVLLAAFMLFVGHSVRTTQMRVRPSSRGQLGL